MAQEPNNNCKIELVIQKASFKKDSDTFGKQDPFMRFTYDGRQMQTSVKTDAGKEPVWNETFILEDIAT